MGQLTRAEASILKLPELNPYVKVNAINSLALEDLDNYSLVCVTEIFHNINHVIEANHYCRERNIGFILT